jgi:hypothetical protein
MSGEPREMSREERTAVRKLVAAMCANYDHTYGCLPLGYCYMFGKWWTGAYCKYFRAAVLPLDPALEAALTDTPVDMRPCAGCGLLFPVIGKKAYCSRDCEKTALRIQKRDYMRKKRAARGKLPR